MMDAYDRIHQHTSGTHAVIDLDAYARNIQTLRSLTPSCAFMAVVKADAYGHGAATCGQAAIDAGATMLGVARISEALYLRERGVSAPILVLGPPTEASIGSAIQSNITLAIGSEPALSAIQATADRLGRDVTVHLKVDTGMRRYGFRPDEVGAIAERVRSSSLLELEGVFTHFSSADDRDESVTPDQIRLFERAAEELTQRGIDVRYRHVANSAAILRGLTGSSNMVRSGIATYGLSPSEEVPVDRRFDPILSIRSTVARRFALNPGDSVSYNRTYIAAEVVEAADVSIGYADGLPKGTSNAGWFLANGQRCPILGRVCMDQVVIEAPVDMRVGDAVIVIGSGRNGEMTFEDAGRMAGTNNYEVATRLTARVPRVYLRNGEPVAWEHLLTGDRGVLKADVAG